MDIEAIRMAFSKAGIAVGGHGVKVIYTYNERWVTQSMFDDDRDVFLSLLRTCDYLTIECISGRVLKLTFFMTIDGRQVVFYSPVTEEVSLKELRMLSEYDDIKDEFCEWISDEDLDDKNAIIRKFVEMIDKERQLHASDPVDITAIERWRKVSKATMKFAAMLGLETNITEPDYDFDGSITVFFPGDRRIVMVGELKSTLLDAVVSGTGVDIECSVNDGLLNLTLYA